VGEIAPYSETNGKKGLPSTAVLEKRGLQPTELKTQRKCPGEDRGGRISTKGEGEIQDIFKVKERKKNSFPERKGTPEGKGKFAIRRS